LRISYTVENFVYTHTHTFLQFTVQANEDDTEVLELRRSVISKVYVYYVFLSRSLLTYQG
jgi:hypothetical protein